MKRSLILCLLIFFGNLVSETLCEEKTITLGVLASLSDEFASLGDMQVKGINLAIEDIAKEGGINGVNFVTEIQDTFEATSGARAVTAYQSLRQQKIKYFIGPIGTPAGLALAPIIKLDPEVLIITPTVGVKEFHLAGDNIFNARGADETGSMLTARYAWKKGWRKAAVFSSQQPWELVQGDAFAKEFIKLGGIITSKQEPLPDTDDLRTPALKIFASKPDVIFFSDYTRMPVAAKALMNLGYRGPKLTTVIDESIRVLAKDSLDGGVFISYPTSDQNYTARFKAKYGVEPSIPADYAYDAVMAMAKAMRASDPSKPTSVREALKKVSFEGAAGHFEFDDQGCAKRELVTWKIGKDSFEKVLE